MGRAARLSKDKKDRYSWKLADADAWLRKQPLLVSTLPASGPALLALGNARLLGGRHGCPCRRHGFVGGRWELPKAAPVGALLKPHAHTVGLYRSNIIRQTIDFIGDPGRLEPATPYLGIMCYPLGGHQLPREWRVAWWVQFFTREFGRFSN